MIKQKAPYHKRMPKKVEGIKCPKCCNDDIRNFGTQKNVSTGEKKKRYWCNECDLHFVLRIPK